MRLINRVTGYLFIKIFSMFPFFYRLKVTRQFFTKNYQSGLVAIGERFSRFQAIGPQWIHVDIKDCDKKLEFATASVLPFPDNSQEIIYSTHMIEHLTPNALEIFVRECFRVLKRGGYLRFEAPDAEILVKAAKEKDSRFIEMFRDPSCAELLSDERYNEDHVGILGVLNCYVLNGKQLPVYVNEKTFLEKINEMNMQQLERWLQTLQTEEQQKTHGHNNLIYFDKLKYLSKKNGANECWRTTYGSTQIPNLYLNNVERRHKNTIIEGPHRSSYSIYFEARKA